MDILNATTCRVAPKRRRVYAAPQFVRLDGTWTPINSALSVSREGEVYRVALGNDWITWTPRRRPKGQLKRTIVTVHHFGDVLNPAEAPDVAEYDVTFSAGVEPTESGWRFRAAGGVELGLFLSDWLDRFGQQRVMLDSNYAAVDLAGVTADELGEINLDPATISPADGGLLFGLADYGWESRRNATEAFGYYTSLFVVFARQNLSATHQIGRAVLRFDTSTVTAAKSVTLYLTRSEGDDNPANMHVSRCRFDVALDKYDFPVVKDGYETGPIGVMERVSGNLWRRDITSFYESTQTFDLGIVEHDHDVLNVAPVLEEFRTQFAISGNDAPYLEIEEVSVGYRFYRGAGTPAAIDYTTPAAEIDKGNSAVDIPIELIAGQPQIFAVRRVSPAGVEEQNFHVLAYAEIDANNNLLSPPVDVTREVTVTVQPDGSVLMAFSYRPQPGFATAVQFEVFSDSGTGSLDLQTPVTVVEPADDQQENFETLLPVVSLPALFAVRTVSSDRPGPLSQTIQVPVTVSPLAPQVL